MIRLLESFTVDEMRAYLSEHGGADLRIQWSEAFRRCVAYVIPREVESMQVGMALNGMGAVYAPDVERRAVAAAFGAYLSSKKMLKLCVDTGVEARYGGNCSCQRLAYGVAAVGGAGL